MSFLELQEVSKSYGEGPASQYACHHRQLVSSRLTELAALVNPEGAPKRWTEVLS
jgi:hypothetical protein